MRYRKARRCNKCNTKISMYNPYDLCWICQRKYCDLKGISYSEYQNKHAKEKRENTVKQHRPTKMMKYAQEVTSEAQLRNP